MLLSFSEDTPMTVDELRKHITAVPFFPFHIRTGAGRRIPVLNRDFILITPTQSHVFVFQPDNSHQVLDINLIIGVEFGPPAPPVAVPNLNA
jgi:hypothetical protein